MSTDYCKHTCPAVDQKFDELAGDVLGAFDSMATNFKIQVLEDTQFYNYIFEYLNNFPFLKHQLYAMLSHYSNREHILLKHLIAIKLLHKEE